MNRRPLLIVLGFLMLAGGGAWWWLRPTPARQIRRQLDRLVAALEKTEPETPIQAGILATRITTYFAESFELIAGSPFEPIRTGAELSSQIARVRATVDRLHLRTDVSRIDVAPDGRSAVMDLHARADVRAHGESAGDEREFEVEWVREGGSWKIRRATVVSAIQRPLGI